jgi:3-oxoacyl-[acyl-carrier protein] reductase
VDYGLRRRVAIVTGSSSGIGRATAEALAAEGARVVITYCRGAERGEALAASLRAAGGDAFAAHLDLSAPDSIARVTQTTLVRWGRIDILVNNAVKWPGHLIRQAPPFEALPGDEWRPFLRANIEGVFATIQSVLPAMRAQHWGRIVTVSAVAAADGMRGAGSYSAAKAALHGLTRSLAREVGVDGILANVVMPGLTLSDRAMTLVPDHVRQTAADHTPIGHLLRPADVARAVVFLASAANTAITGEVIRTSGGYLTPHERPAPVRRETSVDHPMTDLRFATVARNEETR